jgi:hypothetical protein
VKAKQLRRAQEMQKNVAARDDEMEHQVENTEELTPADDGQANSKQPGKEKGKKKQDPEDDKPRLDVTA